MHGTISQRQEPGKLAPFAWRMMATVYGYCDTMFISSSRAFPSALVKALIPLCGKAWPEAVGHKSEKKTTWCHLLKIHQPSLEAMLLLDTYMREAKHYVAICRVHIAFDFDAMPGLNWQDVIDLVENTFVMRHSRASDKPHEFRGMRSAITAKGRKTRPSKNAVFYADRPGKLDGEDNKPHYEIRLDDKRAVITSGIEYPSEIVALDLLAFLARHVTIIDREQMFKRTIASTKRGKKENPHYDIDRSVRNYMRRMGHDNAEQFKRSYRKIFERLAKLDASIVLNVVNRMQFVQRKAGGGVKVNMGANENVGECASLACRPVTHPRSRPRIRIGKAELDRFMNSQNSKGMTNGTR